MHAVNRSLVVLDDRAVLVDGIRTVAQFTYPDLHLVTGTGDTTASEDRVIIIGGSMLEGSQNTGHLRALVASGAAIIALVDSATSTDVYALRTDGVTVFVCASEGMNELLRAIDRAFAHESYLSPDSEVLFSRPARIPPRISPRERQIVLLYLSENDWSVDDVARMLQISSQTVRSHLARLRSHFTAAGFTVRNRLELRQTLVEIGVIDAALPAAPYALPSAALAAAEPTRFRFTGDPAFAAQVG